MQDLSRISMPTSRGDGLPSRPPIPRRLRLQVLSDVVHAGSSDDLRPEPGVDVVVVAGDVTDCAVETVRLVRDRFPAPLPVVLVLGDQEYRGGDQDCTLLRAKGVARSVGITMLEDAQAVIGGVRFVGSTFWTDFRLHGTDVSSIEIALDAAEVPFRALDARDGPRPLSPYGSLIDHWRSRTELILTLREPHPGPTVILTHHAPSALSLPESLRGDPIAPALASPCEDVVRASGAALWIHGGVPAPVDYALGATRVVARPHRSDRGLGTVLLE